MNTEHYHNGADGAEDITEEVFTPEMAEGIPFDPSIASEIEVGGMDPFEFAQTVAEMTSSFLPEGSNADEFKRKYVSFVGPMLKLGGFEKLTAGMTLGGAVDKYPWLGVIICTGAVIGGVVMYWPKPETKPEQEPEQEYNEGAEFAYG